MNRTITIKGVGKLSLKPDYTVVSMSLKTTDKNYDRAIDKAAECLEDLKEAICGIGFKKDDLKTTNFNVNTEYESRRDKDGVYKQYFVGYAVRHQMKIEFDFDSDRLSKTLGAVANCIAEPELNIQFTVKDKESVNQALLENACENARKKAEILAKASGVALGNMVSVFYNWSDRDYCSPTRYEMADKCMLKANGAARSINIEPDEIDVSDNVTFVWEIS